MELETIIFGDPHCDFTAVEEVAMSVDPARPPLCIFVGDFGFTDVELSNWEQGTSRHGLPRIDTRTPDEILRPLADLGCRILHVRGNHDFDDQAQYGAVIGSHVLRGGNLHCRVVEINGVRIAGLEGVFGGPWQPKLNAIASPNRQHWLDTNKSYKNGQRWCHSLEKQWGIPPGLQVRHRQFIWPDEYEYLRTLEADVLITHEAPLSPECPRGYQQINDLAADMGVKVIIHGHTHREYETLLENGVESRCAPIKSYLHLDLSQYAPLRNPSL
jgi:Predicted phosphoesterases, related to the Icc protein